MAIKFPGAKRPFRGFLLGVLLAGGFYYVFLKGLGVDTEIRRPFGLCLVVVLGLSCALSEEVQCVGLICFTMFCSRKSRRTLQAMIFALLITGPGTNMIHNTKEAVRSFSCAAELGYNVSKEYAYLTVSPYTSALLGVSQKSAESVSQAVQSVQHQITPLKTIDQLDNEDENLAGQLMQDDYPSKYTILQEKYKLSADDTDGEKIEKKFLKRVEMECLNMLKNSTEQCKDVFAEMYEQCTEKLSPSVSWLLCWPMKVDAVCDLTWMVVGSAPCDAKEGVGPGFGATLNTLNKTDGRLADTLGQARFSYKAPDYNLHLKAKDVAYSAKNVVAEVKARAESAEILLSFVSKVVALLFLPTILGSVKYVNDYLRRLSFDNKYITEEFVRLDDRRNERGAKPVLLPLRKRESKNLVLLSNKFPNGPERGDYFPSCSHLILLLLVVLLALSTDHLYYKTLQIVARHGKFHVTLVGNHTVHIKVKGTGFVAKMVRSLTKGFNKDSDAFVNQTFTNEHCLPQPTGLDTRFKVKICFLLVGMIVLVAFDHVQRRMRRWICAKFYPKREKQRAIFLYNKLLQSRMHNKEAAKEKLKRLLLEMEMGRQYKKEATLLRRLCSFLFRNFFSKNKCCLCDEAEGKDITLIKCINCQNKLHFCADCWKELDCVCLICSVKINVN